MLTIIILIILNIFIYKIFKKNKLELEKDNLTYMKKRKNHNKVRYYNIPIRMIVFNFIFLLIWLGISFFINKTLLSNFEESVNSGLLRYNVLEKIALKEIEDDNDKSKKTFVYGYKSNIDNLEETRAYYYILANDTEVSKSISTAIKLNITEEESNYQTEGNLIYDRFLKLFFFQFYSYQYKQVYSQEENILFLDIKE